MIRTVAALFLTLSTGLAGAQEGFDYSEEQSFEFLGVHENGLVVSMSDQVVLCDLAESSEKDYLSLDGCRPIVAPGHATGLRSQRRETAFKDMVANAPKESFASSVTRVLRDQGCSVDLNELSKDAFFDLVIKTFAATNGYQNAIPPNALDIFQNDKMDEAGKELEENGIVVFDNDTRILTLIECE